MSGGAGYGDGCGEALTSTDGLGCRDDGATDGTRLTDGSGSGVSVGSDTSVGDGDGDSVGAWDGVGLGVGLGVGDDVMTGAGTTARVAGSSGRT